MRSLLVALAVLLVPLAAADEGAPEPAPEGETGETPSEQSSETASNQTAESSSEPAQEPESAPESSEGGRRIGSSDLVNAVETPLDDPLPLPGGPIMVDDPRDDAWAVLTCDIVRVHLQPGQIPPAIITVRPECIDPPTL